MSQDKFLKSRPNLVIDEILKSLMQNLPADKKLSFQIMQHQKQQKTVTPLEDEVHLLKDQHFALESRVDSLEFKSNISPIQDKIGRIEDFTNKIFSEIPIITNVSYRPSSSGLTIIVIHNSDDVSNAIDQIQKGISKLEEAFPNIYFEPWVLHITEVRNEHLQQSKTIFQR